MSKSMLEGKTTSSQIERRLWHGTDVKALDSICLYGFNRAYCGKNGKRLVYAYGLHGWIGAILTKSDSRMWIIVCLIIMRLVFLSGVIVFFPYLTTLFFFYLIWCALSVGASSRRPVFPGAGHRSSYWRRSTLRNVSEQTAGWTSLGRHSGLQYDCLKGKSYSVL